jgi:hypothetical protein
MMDAFEITFGQLENETHTWPRIERAEVMNDGQELGILLGEFDGTISAIRITVDQLAD